MENVSEKNSEKSGEMWFDYRSRCYNIGMRNKDHITDQEALRYIPKTRFSHSAYKLLRKNGKSVRDSMIIVLSMFLDF